jgi:hypothetical protein
MASARDLATKLDATISAADMARYMLAFDGTDHVRQALEGKPVTLPPARATETVTSDITPTATESDECALCSREPERFFRLSDTGKELSLCDDCVEPLYLGLRDAVYGVTDDVTRETETTRCALCFEEATHFYRHPETGKELLLCKDCMERVGIAEQSSDTVTDDVTQDENETRRHSSK